MKAASDRENSDRDRLAKLRAAHKETEAKIMRLLELVENGLMHAEDAELRERLTGLKLQRDEIAREAADLQKRIASGEPRITPEKVGRLAVLLRDKLHDGPPELRQAYARLLLNEVTVSEQEIRISGSKAVPARTASENARIYRRPCFAPLFENGAPDRIRTCDLCLRRAALYPAELRVRARRAAGV